MDSITKQQECVVESVKEEYPVDGGGVWKFLQVEISGSTFVQKEIKQETLFQDVELADVKHEQDYDTIRTDDRGIEDGRSSSDTAAVRRIVPKSAEYWADMAAFATEIENNPCLWRMNVMEYKDITMKAKVWSRLAEQFGFADGTAARTRFESLRGRYQKEKKKHKPSGSGAEEEPNPILQIWAFTENCKISHRSTSNFRSARPLAPLASVSPSPFIRDPPILPVAPFLLPSGASLENLSAPIPPRSSTPNPSPSSAPPMTRKRNIEESIDAMLSAFSEYSQVATKRLNIAPESADSMWLDAWTTRVKAHFSKLERSKKRRIKSELEDLAEKIEDLVEMSRDQRS